MLHKGKGSSFNIYLVTNKRKDLGNARVALSRAFFLLSPTLLCLFYLAVSFAAISHTHESEDNAHEHEQCSICSVVKDFSLAIAPGEIESVLLVHNFVVQVFEADLIIGQRFPSTIFARGPPLFVS